MKALLLVVLASTTAAAAPACPRAKHVPVEIPAVGCPLKVEHVGCDRCLLPQTVGISLTYATTDGTAGAWREGFENAGWKVTPVSGGLAARKGHDRATVTFSNLQNKRVVYLQFTPG
jgi:hypothetical protein